MLVGEGVTRDGAERLVRDHPEQVARQLSYWKYRPYAGKPNVLVSSIQQGGAYQQAGKTPRNLSKSASETNETAPRIGRGRKQKSRQLSA
jgi:hypothetical protein